MTSLCLLLICSSVSTDTLPLQSVLFEALDTFHARNVNALLAEFEESKKGAWMDYMPSIGIAYTPTGEPRPGVSYSFSQLRTTINKKKTIEAKRKSIRQKAAIAKATNILKLRNLLRKYNIKKNDLQFMNAIHSLDKQLWEFYKVANEKGDLEPIAFIQHKKEYLTKVQSIERKKEEIKLLELDILEEAHY